MSVKRILSTIVLASVVILAEEAIPSGAARMRSSSLSPSLAPAMYQGPEVQISTPSSPIDADRHKPAVAHNWKHHEYLVVWHNQWPGNRDIYAQRVSESGQLTGPWFAVSYDSGDRFHPAVAYNATNDEYLVVWQHEISSNVYEVWGRRITWNGANLHLPQYAEFKIFSWVDRSFVAPRVAWNSYRNEYLVVWSAYDTGTLLNTDVACKRVLADGSMPYGHLIISNVGNPQEVDIVYNVALDGYMVVWARDSGVTNYDIYGAFLDYTGAKITPPGEFPVYGGPSTQIAPAVTTNEQNHYMVVWQHFDDSYSPGDWDIYGRLFQANGSPVTDPFMLSSTTYDEMLPDVAANGATQQYLTVWHRDTGSQSIVTARLRDTDGTLVPPVDVLNAPGWNAAAPVVACDIPDFLIVYEKGSGWDPYHIYGRIWWSEVVYLPLVLRAYTE
jgi:hypothetical protein